MPDLPNALALTSIPSGSEILSSTHNNNYAAVQAAVNALIAALSGGTGGQVLTATDSDTVAMAALPAPPTVGIGTALPGTPDDGDEFVLVDSLTAPTYAWRFRYVSGISDANKWVFVGGSPLQAEADATVSTSSTTYVDLGSGTPAVTVPRAGVYEVAFGVDAYASAGQLATMYAAVKVGSASAADVDGVSTYNFTGAPPAGDSVARTIRRTCAASDVLKLQYRVAGAEDTGQFYHRWIKVIPVRVA